MSRTTEHKEGEATVKIYYKVSKTLADGSHPFQVRITKDRKQVFRSTGLSLHPKFWDKRAKNFREAILVDKANGFPREDQRKLITKLAEWEAKYQKAALTLAETDEQHAAPDVLSKAIESRKVQRRIRLLAYIEELAAAMVASGKIGNSIIYRDLASQLAKFIASEDGKLEPPLGKGQEAKKAKWVEAHDVPFERVTVAFCHSWEDTLRATGATDTTLSNRFRTLRAVLNKAIATGAAKADNYPFSRTTAEKHKYSLSRFDVTTAKRAIGREEIRRLEALEPATDQQQLALDLFLFSFFGGGINFVDMGQLRWRDLTGNEESGYRLNYTRQKTGGKFSLKLLAPAVAIVARYRPFTYGGPNSYLFPILDAGKHTTAQQVKNRLHKVMGNVNRSLKILGQQAGIGVELTSYVARHSMADTLRKSGAATAVISQAMGHRSEAVTAVYLNSFASDVVDAAFDGLL